VCVLSGVFMAGKTCPNCGKQTFFISKSGRECSQCSFKMIVPPNKGMGGLGTKCSNCNRQTVFNNQCSHCGVRYVMKNK